MNRQLTEENVQMANKHMNRFSTLYVIREMQVDNEILLQHIRIVKIQNPVNIKC